MKKTVKLIAALCLMAALVLTLAACGDSLEGTWKCTNYKDAMLDFAASLGIDRAQAEADLKAASIDDMIFNITLKKNTCSKTKSFHLAASTKIITKNVSSPIRN